MYSGCKWPLVDDEGRRQTEVNARTARTNEFSGACSRRPSRTHAFFHLHDIVTRPKAENHSYAVFDDSCKLGNRDESERIAYDSLSSRGGPTQDDWGH